MTNKNFWLSLVLTLGLAVTTLGQTQATDALEGLDPVMLVQGKEAQGDLKISVTRGQFRYLFASEANKTAFEKDPARYEIQLGGACARMGAPTRGIADLYTVHNGRIYIFGSEGCKKLFVAAPEKYLTPARTAFNPTPEASRKGQELLEKAVVALGGATKLDSLTSYHQQCVSAQTRGQNNELEVKVQNDLLVAFPDRIRLGRAMPDFRDPAKMMQQTLVLLPGEEFGLGGPRGTFQVPTAARELEENQLRQHPLFMLRERKQAGFKAAALEAEKAGVERVAVEFKGEQYVFGIEAASGRVLSMSRKQRGRSGDFGELVQTFSDYRTVDGLMLPFKITATFNGQPWNEQSFVIETITLNGKIDPALFEKTQVKQ